MYRNELFELMQREHFWLEIWIKPIRFVVLLYINGAAT